MEMRRETLVVFSIASILVLAGFSANEKAYAGAPAFPPFGDFKCWINVDDENTPTSNVLLGIQDQFGFIENNDWTQIEYCAAANKSFDDGETFTLSPFDGEAFGLRQHYQGWEYPDDTIGPGTGKTVEITVAQFDQSFNTILLDLEQIFVPATKIIEGPTSILSVETDQHWNCYEITGPAVEGAPLVNLKTQHFDGQNLDIDQVFTPFLFCAPMIKTDPFEEEFGALFDEHMICYNIQNQTDFAINLPIALEDQMNDGSVPFEIEDVEKLCVPALKTFPVVGGFVVPIDSSALLLAGVQSISMWMIPVVAAGIGIGIFIIKRRN